MSLPLLVFDAIYNHLVDFYLTVDCESIIDLIWLVDLR